MADRAAAAVVIVLCVVALALTASTLSATSSNQRGAGEGETPGISDDPLGQPTPANESGGDPPGLPADWVAIAIAVALALAIPAALVLGRHRVLGVAAGALLLLGLVVLFALVAGSDVGLSPPNPLENATSGAEGGGDAGDADESREDQPRDLPSILTLGIVGVALVAALGVVYYASASVDASVDPKPPADPEPADSPTVGEAAGRAADRIDDHEGDPENAVYAAWVEMTDAIDVVDPATSTPGEFADAAVAAGMDESRVADLTDLFERVRYGDEPVTEAHERRAAETLRAIRDAHGTADPAVDRVDEVADATDERDGGPVGGSGSPPESDSRSGDRS